MGDFFSFFCSFVLEAHFPDFASCSGTGSWADVSPLLAPRSGTTGHARIARGTERELAAHAVIFGRGRPQPIGRALNGAAPLADRAGSGVARGVPARGGRLSADLKGNRRIPLVIARRSFSFSLSSVC